ncbi:hypothetical protein ACS0TY_004015 [Phlomoides rotata]
MKKHLVGRNGDIIACKKVSHDDPYDVVEVKEELNTIQLNTHAQKKVALLTSIGKRKRDQPMGSYFAPRTTLGAQPSI